MEGLFLQVGLQQPPGDFHRPFREIIPLEMFQLFHQIPRRRELPAHDRGGEKLANGVKDTHGRLGGIGRGVERGRLPPPFAVSRGQLHQDAVAVRVGPVGRGPGVDQRKRNVVNFHPINPHFILLCKIFSPQRAQRTQRIRIERQRSFGAVLLPKSKSVLAFMQKFLCGLCALCGECFYPSKKNRCFVNLSSFSLLGRYGIPGTVEGLKTFSFPGNSRTGSVRSSLIPREEGPMSLG